MPLKPVPLFKTVLKKLAHQRRRIGQCHKTITDVTGCDDIKFLA